MRHLCNIPSRMDHSFWYHLWMVLCPDLTVPDPLTGNVVSANVCAPKALCVLSRFPLYHAFRKFLFHLYRLQLSPSPLPLEVRSSTKISRSFLIPLTFLASTMDFFFSLYLSLSRFITSSALLAISCPSAFRHTGLHCAIR